MNKILTSHNEWCNVKFEGICKGKYFQATLNKSCGQLKFDIEHLEKSSTDEDISYDDIYNLCIKNY